MKKFQKTFIALLLLVSMLGNIAPGLSLALNVNAADAKPVYKYVASTKVEPGKTYIIANGSNGNISALKVNNGTAEGGAVSSGSLTAANNIISDFADAGNYEWTVVPGRAKIEGTGYALEPTYMLQNVGTGAYLYNPVYDTGDGTGMNITYDPLTDNYSPYTRQVYNSAEAVNAYISKENGGTYKWDANWATLGGTAAGGDPQVKISLGDLNLKNSDYIYAVIHNKGVDKFALYRFYNNTHAGGEGYEASKYLPKNVWSVFDIGGHTNGIVNGSTQKLYRFDIDENDANGVEHKFYLSSTFIASNPHSVTALQYYRRVQACYGNNGYYPSQRFPFCQYAFSNAGGYNFKVGNFATSRNSNYYGEMYFYGWNGSSFSRGWNADNGFGNGNTVFFEKQLVSEPEYRWQLVESDADIVNGGEYIIANTASLDTSFSVINESGAAATVANSSAVSSSHIWRIQKTGDYFYLLNSKGNVLKTASNGTVGTMSQGDSGGGTIPYGTRYRFNYDAVNHKLTANTVNQNAGEQIQSSNVAAGGQNAYLYKKVYHTHDMQEIERVEARCEEDGYIKYKCSGCDYTETEVITKLGHDYISKVTEPTCTAGGYTEYTCSRCDYYSKGDLTTALGHDFGDWIVIREATETESGLRQRTCKRCDFIEEQETPKLGKATVKVSSTTVPNADAGLSASVDVTLEENPGLYGQHFVIYFPKELKLENVEHSGLVYPLGGVQDSDGFNVDPAENERLKAYFDAAGIDSNGYRAYIYVAENTKLSNITNNGKLFTLTFKLPEYACGTEYNIGIFGVYKDGGHDAVNIFQQSVNINYTGGSIKTAESHNWVLTESKDATCTEDGYKIYTCSNCHLTEKRDVVAASGHKYGEWEIVREPSGMSEGLRRRVCSVCGKTEEEKFGVATGTGISQSVNTESYVYRLTDKLLPGKEYIIANKNSAGDAFALSGNETKAGSKPVTVKNDGTPYIEDLSDSILWNTSGSDGKVILVNKESGKYLSAATNEKTRIDLNVYSTDDPYSNAQNYLYNGNKSESGAYLGFKDKITETVTAAPSDNYMRIGGWAFWKGFETKDNFALDFDMAFEDNTADVELCRGGVNRFIAIVITSKSIKLTVNGVEATGTYSEYEGSDRYNFKHWSHFRIECKNDVVSVKVNGVEVVSLSGASASPELEGFLFAGALGSYEYNTLKCAVDNLKIETTFNGNTYVQTEDFESGFDVGKWDSYNSSKVNKLEGSVTVGQVNTVATNAFVASGDSKNKVYFYEKTPVSEMSFVYQLTDNIEQGETYVLVSANSEGAASALNSSVSEEAVNVRCDGVSYTPYVSTKASLEFSSSKLGSGWLLCSAGGKYLTENGASDSVTADNAVSVKDGKVTVNGKEYYLYKKTAITRIDTALSKDVAAIDFGFGFSVGDSAVIRANDSWADRVTLTMSGIANLEEGVKTSEWFYPSSVISGKGDASLSAGSASFADGKITFRADGKLESVESFGYEMLVDGLGAYMYGNMYIIPATSVYYEDSAPFITYTNGAYPANGGAAWTVVGNKAEINGVLESAYGYSDAYASFTEHSGGFAHMVRVSASNVDPTYRSAWMPTASFTFSGTGFEVMSAVGKTTCAVFVAIQDVNTGKTVKNIIVDNYFGYTLNEDGKWVPSTDADTSLQLYQVPVIKWDNGSDVPGNYRVTVSVAYDRHLDHANIGYSEFYLDGVRIFEPLDIKSEENIIAKDKYSEDKEILIENVCLRDMLNNGVSLRNGSVMFIDGKDVDSGTDDYTLYNSVGANHEITLPVHSAVAFELKSNGNTDNYKLSLGAKISKGETVRLKVSCGNSSKEFEIKTATDMYYDISEIVKWNNGSAKIVIENASTESGVLLSVTNLKISSGSVQSINDSVTFEVNEQVERVAYRALALSSTVNPLMLGDVNDSGMVSTVDSLTMKRYAAGLEELTEREFAAADMNGDGKITAVDMALMKTLITE